MTPPIDSQHFGSAEELETPLEQRQRHNQKRVR